MIYETINLLAGVLALTVSGFSRKINWQRYGPPKRYGLRNQY